MNSNVADNFGAETIPATTSERETKGEKNSTFEHEEGIDNTEDEKDQNQT